EFSPALSREDDPRRKRDWLSGLYLTRAIFTLVAGPMTRDQAAASTFRPIGVASSRKYSSMLRAAILNASSAGTPANRRSPNGTQPRRVSAKKIFSSGKRSNTPDRMSWAKLMDGAVPRNGSATHSTSFRGPSFARIAGSTPGYSKVG